MLKKTSQVFLFNGRHDDVPSSGEHGYINNFLQSIAMDYIVPEGQSGNDYNVTLTTTVRAPKKGMFRIDFGPSNTAHQEIMVYTL